MDRWPNEYRDGLPAGPAHRRGAGLNPGNRFEAERVHVLGEEWDRQRAEREAEGRAADQPVRVPLQVFADKTKRLINRVQQTSDVPFDITLQ